MDAIETSTASAAWERERPKQAERLPPHVTIPVIAVVSLGLWFLVWRLAGGLLTALH